MGFRLEVKKVKLKGGKKRRRNWWFGRVVVRFTVCRSGEIEGTVGFIFFRRGGLGSW